jgi:hypothetical protein
MKETTEVFYSCFQCNINARKLHVPARAENDPLDEWMQEVNKRLSRDHYNRSPHCQATHLNQIRFFVGKEDDPHKWVGKKV